MPLLEEMHKLGEQIKTDYDARAETIASIRQEAITQRKSTQAQLQELARHHNLMARRLHADLAKGRAELAQSEIERKSQVKAFMNEIASNHTEAQKEWQDMTTSMQAKRNGEKTGTEALHQRAKGNKHEGEKPNIDPLSERVLKYLTNHPKGTRLAELEQELQITRPQANGALRHLMNQDKAKKRDLLYLAN